MAGWFSLVIAYLASFKIQQSPLDNGSNGMMPLQGSYRGLMINLSPNLASAEPSNESLFQVDAGYYISGTPALLYKLYFNQGLTSEAQGYTYRQKPITSFEFALLLPQLVRGDFPLFFPTNSSAIVVARQGDISSFRLDSLAFRFLAQPPRLTGNVDTTVVSFLSVYYVVFLFITPTKPLSCF